MGPGRHVHFIRFSPCSVERTKSPPGRADCVYVALSVSIEILVGDVEDWVLNGNGADICLN